jgi:hypothetical protein
MLRLITGYDSVEPFLQLTDNEQADLFDQIARLVDQYWSRGDWAAPAASNSISVTRTRLVRLPVPDLRSVDRLQLTRRFRLAINALLSPMPPDTVILRQLAQILTYAVERARRLFLNNDVVAGEPGYALQILVGTRRAYIEGQYDLLNNTEKLDIIQNIAAMFL